MWATRIILKEESRGSTIDRVGSHTTLVEFMHEREVELVGDSGGVVTGWASISLVDLEGSSTEDGAVFTLVYGHSEGTWELVTAHKTTVR